MEKKNIVMFPEVWDELTEADWVAMLKLRERLLALPSDSAVSIDDIRREAARSLLLNRGIRTRSSNDKYMLLVYQCGLKLDWLWQTDDEGRVSLVYRSTVNLLPMFDALHGPMSHGADLVFGEFKDAIGMCRTYDATGDFDVLRTLAGLLYRKRRNSRTGKHRLPYDLDNEAEARGRRLPDWFVWGVYAWFSFFCEYLTTGIFIIDGEEVCFSKVFKGSGSQESGSSGNGLGLNAIALTLSETGVFGDFEDVLHTPLLMVMMKLLHDANSLEQLKKRKV